MKRVSIKREKKERKKISFASMSFVGISILLTISLYIGLLFLESYFLEDITYQQIIIAKKEIPEDTIITEENITDLFTTKQINILDVTSNTIKITNENKNENVDLKKYTELIGKKAKVSLDKGESIALKDFEDLNKYIEKIENPIEVSINLGGLANTDAGKIREGDLVNLVVSLSRMYTQGSTSLGDNTPSSTNSNNYTYLSQYAIENLYVSKVLNSAGAEINATDATAVASTLFFIIDKNEELEFYNALNNCSTMQFSKVLNKPEE